MALIDHYFAGKTFAITGAGDGIGRALAIRLNHAACHLWLCDINPARLAETCGILDHDRASVASQIVDCGNRDAVFNWASDIAEQTTHLDGLINNAGVGYGAKFADSTEDNFRWLMDINFWGVVNGTRALLPLLAQAPRGHLVNVSSIFGMIGVPTQSAYNAAKFAVRGFSEALQAEYRGTALAVSCVHPGGIRTSIARAARTDGAAGISDADERDKQFQQLARTTPERAAEIILKGTARGKRRILVGWDAWLIQQFIKLFPTSYHWVTARMAEEPQ